LSNKATILSDHGDNKDVEELYSKAVNLNFMPAVISLCQFLLASQQYEKVKKYPQDIKLRYVRSAKIDLMITIYSLDLYG
jgi:hypothetical protein